MRPSRGRRSHPISRMRALRAMGVERQKPDSITPAQLKLCHDFLKRPARTLTPHVVAWVAREEPVRTQEDVVEQRIAGWSPEKQLAKARELGTTRANLPNVLKARLARWEDNFQDFGNGDPVEERKSLRISIAELRAMRVEELFPRGTFGKLHPNQLQLNHLFTAFEVHRTQRLTIQESALAALASPDRQDLRTLQYAIEADRNITAEVFAKLLRDLKAAGESGQDS